MMLSVPPDVSAPHGVASGLAASACIMSSAIATISPSKRVALGQMSRCRTFACEKSPNASFRNS